MWVVVFFTRCECKHTLLYSVAHWKCGTHWEMHKCVDQTNKLRDCFSIINVSMTTNWQLSLKCVLSLHLNCKHYKDIVCTFKSSRHRNAGSETCLCLCTAVVKKITYEQDNSKTGDRLFTCKCRLMLLPEQQSHSRGFLLQVKLMMPLSASPPTHSQQSEYSDSSRWTPKCSTSLRNALTHWALACSSELSTWW